MIMDATYCVGGDMDFGRMFDQYLHKGSESFDLALSVPDSSSHHSYMADQKSVQYNDAIQLMNLLQQSSYGAYESAAGRVPSGDSYQDLNPMSTHAPHESSHTPHSVPQQHPQQAMYQMGIVGGLHGGGNNPQFPPQNLYIPPISQHGPIMAAQTTGYVSQCIGPTTPVYTSAGLGVPGHHAPHPMMVTASGMMPAYYQRPPMPRSGGSPTSGGSPSPGSDDSDDSAPITQGGRGKRPSPEVPAEPAPAKGKKARVSKKSKKKKDPNEPQKPVSAYALFFRDTQAAIKGQNPNASFGEVSKIVASMWDALDADNKSVYKKKTEAAKKEYLKALAAYRASLVSKGGDGDPMFGGPGQPYGPFGANPSYGFNTTTNAGQLPPHPQGHSPPQLSPLAKKSPLLSSLMTGEGGQQALMNPPMSQPMPPSAPSMMTHGSLPNMNQGSMGQSGPQVTHQPSPSQAHLNQMSSVPPTSPYMTQSNPSLGSPVSSMGSDVGSPGAHSIHKQTQQQPNQQQQQQSQQPSQQQNNTHQQQTSPQHQGHHPLHQHGSNQGGGGGGGLPASGPNGAPLCNGGSCIRSGCTNPAVHNPEWEDEYCSNECVVNHCSAACRSQSLRWSDFVHHWSNE